jgi:hypothetical protein
MELSELEQLAAQASTNPTALMLAGGPVQRLWRKAETGILTSSAHH